MSSHSVLIPVPWETRNLGMPSFAVSKGFLSHPNDPELELAIATQSAISERFFVQARIPKKYYSACSILEKREFYFVESVLSTYVPFRRNKLFERFLQNRKEFIPDRFNVQDFSLEEHRTLSAEECKLIQDIAYDSFVDDRFHLDKNCENELASQRFVYWMADLIADPDAIFYILRYNQIVIGFGAFKSNIFSLMGFSHNYRNSGLGDFLLLSCMEYVSKFDYIGFTSMISVNNIPILNTAARIGARFKHPMVTFHYWNPI